MATSVLLLPALCACSGSYNFGGPGPAQQAAAVPPPPNSSVGPAGQPGSAPPGTTAAAGSTNQPHVDFRNMFRDPPAQGTAAPAAAEVTGAYPSQSLVDLFKSDGAEATPAQATPAQSTPVRTTYVPHPPTTYTPSGQPYSPPSGQPAYGAAPTSTSTAAAPAAPRPQDTDVAAHSGAYPSQSLIDVFKNSGQ